MRNANPDKNGQDLPCVLSAKLATFGARLKEERVRLGKSQLELAVAGGVARQTQYVYEAGGRAPDVIYLERVRCIGVDIGYLLSGQRLPQLGPNTFATTPSQMAWIFKTVEESCIDDVGQALPFEVRAGMFKAMCTMLSGGPASNAEEASDLSALRERFGGLCHRGAETG